MGLNLKSLRKEKKMTQQELAIAVGASKRQIGAWERGENDIPMDYAVAIADVLECSVDSIAGRDSSVPAMDLDWRERTLIRLYRNLDESTKGLLIEQAKMYSLACEMKKESAERHEVVAR